MFMGSLDEYWTENNLAITTEPILNLPITAEDIVRCVHSLPKYGSGIFTPFFVGGSYNWYLTQGGSYNW